MSTRAHPEDVYDSVFRVGRYVDTTGMHMPPSSSFEYIVDGDQSLISALGWPRQMALQDMWEMLHSDIVSDNGTPFVNLVNLKMLNLRARRYTPRPPAFAAFPIHVCKKIDLLWLDAGRACSALRMEALGLPRDDASHDAAQPEGDSKSGTQKGDIPPPSLTDSSHTTPDKGPFCTTR
ncbi:hypothetical protein C8Q74DRAFT_1442473 [Fomes fomentarius]|nr:hypothetical protein C8Q74DRAFT_1442473 [Fomes fomentarius]